MPPEAHQTPEDDIRQAVEAAQAESGVSTHDSHAAAPAESETLVHAHGATCPVLGLRVALAKCGMMAERYPWQTLAMLLACVGCGWVCVYFGWSVLGALVLFAATADE